MRKTFDYEQDFMGVRIKKPDTYLRTFRQDYRMRSLVQSVKAEGCRLLDVGCGGGLFTESIPYYYPKSVVYGCDIDISKTAISYAKKYGSGRVRYKVIKDKRLPYRDNYFDICLCLDVLEHIQDNNLFLKELYRILKRNGKVFFIVPCEGQPFTYTWIFKRIPYFSKLTYRFMGHVQPEFTHKNVIELLRYHNFQIEKISYSEHIFYQLMHLFIYFLPKILLEFLLGIQKTKEYTNSNLIKSPKSNKELFMVIRKIWYKFMDIIMMYPMNWETVLFNSFSPTAWKLHTVVSKK